MYRVGKRVQAVAGFSEQHPFPIMLAPRLLAERGVLIIGGGGVAARKVRDVLAVGGRVTLIAPDILPDITDLAATYPERLSLHIRAYQPGDIAASNAILFIAATSVRAVNSQIADEAHNAGKLVNVVDDIAACDYILPSAMYQGEITLSVATSNFRAEDAGASPALAAHLRRTIEATVGAEYGELARLMREARPAVKARVPSAERAGLWRAIVGSDALRLLRDGDNDAATQVINDMIDEHAHTGQ